MADQTNAMNIRRIARIEAKPGLAASMRAALLELEQATREEEGCREFTFFQALGDESAFLLIEDFASADALETHMKLPHTQGFFARQLAASIKLVEPAWMS